jgi:hypothetical protein
MLLNELANFRTLSVHANDAAFNGRTPVFDGPQ